MNLLLDTHALIWLLEGDNRLSHTARSTIENPDNTKHFNTQTLYVREILTHSAYSVFNSN
ncbi:MAG: hypothetical protein NTX45_02750 [Proteobacteria bacterium]|nr:hypothetical protein [Pseudomonadota bacterium]